MLDFGSSGVGDPACDMAIAWTFLLWKSLITMVGALEEDDDAAVAARRREIDAIISDR